MSKIHTMTLYRVAPMSDDDTEREYVVTYTFSPGRPEQGPSYASGGEPAEPPEVELLEIEGEGSALLDEDWIVKHIMENHEEDCTE